MSNLFDEAIAEAKQLREMAEQNARNKIIESVTPRIRRLIENELMIGSEDEEFSEDDVLSPPIEADEPVTLNLDDLVSIDAAMPSVKVHPGANVDIEIDSDGSVAVDTGDVELELGGSGEASSEEEDLLVSLNQESAMALASMLHDYQSSPAQFSLCENLNLIRRKINGFNKLLNYVSQGRKNRSLRESTRKYYTRLLKEVISLRGDVILTEGVEATLATSKYDLIVKEMKQMSRRHAKTLFDRLFEQKEEKKEELEELDLVFDEEDLDMLGVEDTEAVDVAGLDIGVEMGGEEEEDEEEEISDEVVESFLRRLREQEEFEAEEEIEGEGPIEDVGEVIPVADAESALVDLGAALGLDVSVGEEEEEEVGEETEEEVIEIDEGMLRRELRRMRHLREQEEATDADPYLDHGGDEVGDVIVDVSEEDLINALADELGDPAVPTPTVESRRRRRVRAARQQMSERRSRRSGRVPQRRRGTNVNESRKNRALSGKLVEYKKAVGSLRGQLTEMNLFNAKLLYVNKLMQNRNLTSKQQRAIVEALDNAKTLREAKLLYKSLTTSLNKRGSLTEGRIARTLGSSSRSIRSAQPAKSGVEVDRWAVLAGLNKDN